MENKSGLRPVGRAVLIAPYLPERKESLIVMPAAVESRDHMLEQRATIVELGPSCWCDENGARAAVGDRVLVTAYAGYMARGPLDDKQYRFVNDRDIFAIITGEK